MATEQTVDVVGVVQPEQPIDEDCVRGCDLRIVLGTVFDRNEIAGGVFRAFEGVKFLCVGQYEGSLPSISSARGFISVNIPSMNAPSSAHSTCSRVLPCSFCFFKYVIPNSVKIFTSGISS